MKDFFISYNSADRSWAEWIAWQLNEAEADELADALGDLPLALEQAGAYIETVGNSFSEYLKLFRDYRGELLNRRSTSTDYPDAVATTWEISFRQVKKKSPAGAELLNLCAFLAPDDIPKKLLRDGTQHLPESLADVVADSLAFDDALAALRRYSLLEVKSDALSVHRLVQAIVRDRLEEDAREMWAEAALRLIDDAFPFDSDDPGTWLESSRLLPHVLAALEHAEELKVGSKERGRLLNQVGLFLRERAEFAEAKRLFELSLAIYQDVHGKEHPYVATSLNNLGSVLKDLGEFESAKEKIELALAIDKQTYGEEHPNVAIRLNNLGSVLQNLGDLEGAKEKIELALAIDKQAYGEKHPNVATSLNNLGLVLKDLGEFESARENYELALAIDKQAYGEEHPNVAIRLNNLGSVLQNLGDLEGAKENYELALVIDKQVYSEEHPNVAIDFNNLGHVLKDLGDLEGAKEKVEQALEIFRKFLGDEHPSTVTVRKNLAGLQIIEIAS